MAHEGTSLSRTAETDIRTRKRYSQRSVLTEAGRREGFHGVAAGVGVGGVVQEVSRTHSGHTGVRGSILEDSRASVEGDMQVVRS